MKIYIYNVIHRLRPFGSSTFIKVVRRAQSLDPSAISFGEDLRPDPSAMSFAEDHHPDPSAMSFAEDHHQNPSTSIWVWQNLLIWASRPIYFLSLVKLP